MAAPSEIKYVHQIRAVQLKPIRCFSGSFHCVQIISAKKNSKKNKKEKEPAGDILLILRVILKKAP